MQMWCITYHKCSIWFFREWSKKFLRLSNLLIFLARIKKNMDFELIQDKIYYTNMKGVQVCFKSRFKKLINAAANPAAAFIPVNNFAHCVKKIDITRYSTNKTHTDNSTPRNLEIFWIYAKTSAKRYAKYDSKRSFI